MTRLRWTRFETRIKESNDLPDFNKVTFADLERRPLKELLPNLPTGDTAVFIVELIERMLTYSSSKRIKAKEAVDHEWFQQDPTVKAGDVVKAKLLENWMKPALEKINSSST